MMKVYQIYFKKEQELFLEPEFIPLLNGTCSPYFESKVIEQLVLQEEHLGEPYFGVVAYKLREKLGFMKENWKNNKNIANISVTEFTVERFIYELYKNQPDAMSFQRHAPHDTVMVANGFHPGFRKYWEHIMKEIGFDWKPTLLEHVCYCNYFVARTHIYQDFVMEMLSPAIKVMDEMPELWGNSNYPQALPQNLQDQWGIKHYPFHAFICERFFSWYAHVKNLKCLHY